MQPNENDRSFQQVKELMLSSRRLITELRSLGHGQVTASPTHRFVYFWVMVWQHFVRNRGLVRASSLAYTTLLALIPVLAVAFSVATNLISRDGAEGEKQVEQLIEHLVSTVAPMLDLEVKGGGVGGNLMGPVPDSVLVTEWRVPFLLDYTGEESISRRTEVARSIHGYINRINAKTVGLTSVLAFIFVAVLLFRSIEATFNDIWGVKKGRGWFAGLVHYWTSLTLGPILLILALGVSSSTHFSRSMEWIRNIEILGSLVTFFISWMVYALACSVLYKIMPKTEVKLRSALIGGLVAGFLLQANNKLSFVYFSNVATADKIYGSLGAAPIFLLGLYVSWIILLFGAQVAYAFQNYQSYIQEKMTDRIHQAGREFLGLRVMGFISERFLKSGLAPKLQDLADGLGVASGFTREVVDQLEENHLISETQGTQGGYVPARPPSAIFVQDVLVALRKGKGIDVVSRDDAQRASVRRAYERVEDAAATVSGSVSLADLVKEP